MVAVNPVSPPAPYERGEKTRAEMAAEQGVSERHHRRLLARERAGEAEYAAAADGGPDDSDLPHLSVTADPDRERGHWYEPESGRSSVDSGRVRVGNHNGTRLLVRSVNGGKPVEAVKKKPPKFKPKRPRSKKRPVPAS